MCSLSVFPKSFRKLPKSFRKLPKSFRKLPKSLRKLPRASGSFRKLPKSFRKLPRAFGKLWEGKSFGKTFARRWPRAIGGRQLEDEEVQREALAQLPHHGELVEQGPVVNTLREAVR